MERSIKDMENIKNIMDICKAIYPGSLPDKESCELLCKREDGLSSYDCNICTQSSLPEKELKERYQEAYVKMMLDKL
jgi:hypothetical protein